MKITSDMLRKIAAMPEQAMGVALMFLAEQLEADERKRASSLTRQKRYLTRHRDVKITSKQTSNERQIDGEITLSRVERDINPFFLKEGLDYPPSNPPLLLEPSAFTEFWNAYPPREGGSDRDGAEKAFAAATKRADPAAIIAAAGRFGQEMRRIGKAGTQFVPKARKWLNDGGWKDFEAQSVSSAPPPPQVPVIEGSEAWTAWQRVKGKRLPVTDLKDQSGHPTGKRGWYFPTEFPDQKGAAA